MCRGFNFWSCLSVENNKLHLIFAIDIFLYCEVLDFLCLDFFYFGVTFQLKIENYIIFFVIDIFYSVKFWFILV